MPSSAVERLLRTIFCPCILVYQSVRILICGFLYEVFRGFGLCLKSCCCAFLETVLCCCSCWSRRFIDKSFPPSRKSLGNVDDAAIAEWRRLEDICGGVEHATLVRGGISPCEIGQGGLGDCWLLSSMASLAEFPSLVREVFVIKSANEYQKYAFRLYDEKQKNFRVITVDTWVPCIRGQPMFTRPEQNAMWVPLLEKAVAKMYGSYGALDGGSMEKGIRILSGATIVRIMKPSVGDVWERTNSPRTYKNFMIHDLVRNFDYHKSIMTCSITLRGAYRGPGDLKGLHTGHAYTLVAAYKIGEIRLFKLRNPWGSNSWRGPWGQGSREWDSHPMVRKAVKHEEGAERDGVFFMADSDFTHLFDYMAFGVRDVGFDDIAFEPHEGKTCGSCKGLWCGCGAFWCCCQGMKALCCYKHADPEMEEYDHCCGCCA